MGIKQKDRENIEFLLLLSKIGVEKYE